MSGNLVGIPEAATALREAYRVLHPGEATECLDRLTQILARRLLRFSP